MSDSCAFKLITGYNCGSYAVNPYQNGINQGALCDVHYWEVECQKLRMERDAAYLERNQVVAALSKCFPSVVTKTAIEGWSPEWHNCVYIDLPTGQASWHFHDSHAHLFKDLLVGGCVWDGHTTEQKYERLAALKPNGALLGEKP